MNVDQSGVLSVDALKRRYQVFVSSTYEFVLVIVVLVLEDPSEIDDEPAAQREVLKCGSSKVLKLAAAGADGMWK